MPVDSNILIAYGAAAVRYKKGEILYQQDEPALYFFQVLEGEVKTYSLTGKSREFVQGIFREGESFGEMPLFLREVYATHARTIREAVILKLPADVFFSILEDHPALQMEFLHVFARRIYNQLISIRMLNNISPEIRLLEFLKEYKKRRGGGEDRMQVHYTRQDIANFTGLRVETVIRTLSRLKDKKVVDIVDRKLLY